MFSSEKEFLSLMGWDDFFESQISNPESDLLVRARVIGEERGLYRVQVARDQILMAAVSGRMQFNAKGRVDYPAVGDWVLIELQAQIDRATIHEVLKRKTTLQRKQAGTSEEIQILAANVDYAFITSSVNSDLNLRRFERYLTLVRSSGATPIVLLTKADVHEGDLAELVEGVRAGLPNVTVHATSNRDFENDAFLKSLVKEGTTSVFIGSSGVGKSTIVNFLIGENRAATQAIRDDDSKGRHTTTSRNLYVSRFGGLVIDTPGMRELQLTDQSEGLSSEFTDVEELIHQCKFTDCQHRTEPGCKIVAALASGDLTEERWRGYLKLEGEARHSIRKVDKAVAAQDKRSWKKISIDAKKRGLAKKGPSEAE